MPDYTDLKKAVERGDKDTVLAEVQNALDEGAAAGEILNEGLVAAMQIVGEKMESEEMFIPEVLRSAKTVEEAVELLEPHLLDTPVESAGKVVVGTVKGDLHDIGKNLVGLMLGGAGFDVIDLGVDVAPEEFVEAVRSDGAEIVGMSALLTTTMPVMEKTVKALEDAGLRDAVKIMVGGAPVNESYVKRIGADAYAHDAGGAIKAARNFKKLS